MNKLLLIVYVFLFGFSNLNCKCKTVDEIVAVVNNLVILKSELNNFKKLIELDGSFKKEVDNSKLDNILLNQLIIDKMSYQIALEKNILVNNSDVNRFIENIANQNSISKDVFLKRISLNNININYYKDFIKRKITNNILYNKEIRKLIDVTDKEILDMYKNIDSNKILDLFTSYDFYEIYVPFNEKSKLNININNKSFINNLLFMLKNNYSLDIIKKFINVYNKNVKINEYKDIKLKNLNSIYIPYFNKINKEKFVVDPIVVDNNMYLIKINKIHKENFSRLVNEVNISNILIKDKDLTKEIKDKVDSIYKDIKNNKISFSEAAKKYSEDNVSSNNGGNVGWYIINIYNKDFINEINKLKIGEISKPFFSNKSWNLIKLVNTRNVKYGEFIKKKYIYEYIFNKKFSKELEQWIENNKKLTYIKIYN
ncbi:peptidylprolyl isomerase [endosymbiont of Pachyrhynchus infernalis]|uniref:peptidylprolyl isomerase n=1 Tax=endosymbiont of Pachyrhynchus infernalis TaxID=1971488 RepID=UPI000DC728E6|nr:peptidylprolyl isomerase [endosymbiont of Pachyrhynchus infernalis]BBA84903.1 chaperone SurA [endosymbiont of Pachyrhynchus infernalis]